MKKLLLGALVALAGGLVVGCSTGSGSKVAAGRGGGTGGGAFDASVDGPGIVLDAGPESGGCAKSTCQSLGANCGTVTDPKCGGVIQCGSCPAGQTCGGAGTHNVCGVGSNPDACVPLTCAGQNISCGPAGDGCGGTLNCGSCALPKACGGGGTPGVCGCTGQCANVPNCAAGSTTTLSGKVYDPAGLHPLYHVLVYIPNNPNDPGLQPFPPGVTCDVCGATAAGDPLVTAYTAPDGTFTLSGVPVGSAVPLVIQLGRWRRQFTVPVSTSCGANSIPDKTLTMPKTHAEGDIPRIAILTGSYDPVECVLRKMGVADSEFSDIGNPGHIQFFLANSTQYFGTGTGARIDPGTPAQSQLFATSGGGAPVIDQYDIVILECEGYPQAESASDLAALHAYAAAGGRVFASDYAYTWLYQNSDFSQAASWHVNQNGSGFSTTGHIDLVSNPKGTPFQKWLELVGASSPGSGAVSISPAFHNSDGVVSPTQQWLYWLSGSSQIPLHFTFNTPVGASPDKQCGRVVFSDWHAESGNLSNGKTFPSECPSGAMTPQEAILEFMLFDLSACVQPYQPVCTPRTCADQAIQCGPASDGCGEALDCGTCPSGQYCGGGGPGKCGTSSNCTPQTCKDQGIQCGPAGDGCGDALDCGNCPTGEICGGSGPGKCGTIG